MAPTLIEKPFEAYKGEDPYIFVSYAHEDREEVLRDLGRLHLDGYRIWYDEGIQKTSSFPAELERAIKQSAYVIAFLSKAAVASEWVIREIYLADKEQKQLLPIFLEETSLGGGFEILLGMKQSLMKFDLGPDDYYTQLKKALPSSLLDPTVALGRGPEGDLAREVDLWIASGTEYSDETFLEMGKLLGLAEDVSRRIIVETYQRLGMTADSRKNEEGIRQLVQMLLMRGPIAESSRRTITHRAKELHISPTRTEVIIQEETVKKSKEMAPPETPARMSPPGHRAKELHIPPVQPEAPPPEEIAEDTRQPARPEPEVQAPPAPPVQPVEVAVSAEPPVVAPEPPLAFRGEPERLVTPVGGKESVTWVHIPGGEFVRGCPPEFVRYLRRKYPDLGGTEVLLTYPLRREPLNDFWISLTPITNSQFHCFVKAKGHRYPAGWRGTTPPYQSGNEQRPVTGVTWEDSLAFAEWLNTRLPTRAEYEKACRGENGLLFPWGDTFDASKCNTSEAGREELLPVGAIPEGASPYGVLDMVGNAWQWAADGEPRSRMSVGASYDCLGEIYGVGFFDMSRPPDLSGKDLGFRIACSDINGVIAATT